MIYNENPYIIAEIGHNHGGDLSRCLEMFKVAKECGVDAVKLQKRCNKRLYTKALYDSPYDNENSYGRTYGEHREALEFGFEEYVELKQYAEGIGLDFFATAFDFESVDFLVKLGVKAIKVASGDLLNTPLQRYIAQTGKRVYLSTGGGSYDDVKRAYDTIMPINRDLCILQCTASYPAGEEDMYLGVIPEYIRRFPGARIGFSDHYDGIVMSAVAYILGARVFEKHFTLHHTWKGTDQAFSLEPIGMRKLVRDLRKIKSAVKEGKFLLECEKKPLYKMGKKLVASRAISVGEILTASDIKIVSPNDGMPPFEFDKVVGKMVKYNIGEDDNITWERLE